MQGAIAITDYGWYTFLAARPQITEVNFWTPSARTGFRGEPFSPFLFKLKAPHNAICGFAYFAQYSRLPHWLAWETFGEGNGCVSFEEMRERIRDIRSRIRYDEATGSDEIGCIQLVQPFFLPPAGWVPQPTDWRPRTQRYVKYDLSAGEGLRVWSACLEAAKLTGSESSRVPSFLRENAPRYGIPQLIAPRLGQGTFRVAVLEAYSRACCVTGEHSLPALEASHIQPYSASGPHDVSNGLLFRADLHRLFDKGYITVSPDYRLEVGARLRDDFTTAGLTTPCMALAYKSRKPPRSSHPAPICVGITSTRFSAEAPPNKALQLTVKGRTWINRGRVWRRTSALRATTAAALAGS